MKISGGEGVAGLKFSGGDGGVGVGVGGEKKEKKKGEPSRSPGVLAARSIVGDLGVHAAGATAQEAEGDGGDDSDSDWSVVSDTEVLGIRSLRQKHGEDWRSVLGVEAGERLSLEMEAIKVENGQLSGSLPPSEDPGRKARSILSVMIAKASRKLPRAVHRQILDTFQVLILEPYHYPPVCKVKNKEETGRVWVLHFFRVTRKEPPVIRGGRRILMGAGMSLSSAFDRIHHGMGVHWPLVFVSSAARLPPPPLSFWLLQRIFTVPICGYYCVESRRPPNGG